MDWSILYRPDILNGIIADARLESEDDLDTLRVAVDYRTLPPPHGVNGFYGVIPKIEDTYRWNTIRSVSKELSDGLCRYVASYSTNETGFFLHLKMVGDKPVMFDYYGDFSRPLDESIWVTEIVLGNYKSPIKEVYFILGDEAIFNRCIARKNLAGEFTLVIF